MKTTFAGLAPLSHLHAGPDRPSGDAGEEAQRLLQACGVAPERIDGLPQADRAIALELLAQVRSFVSAQRAHWPAEEATLPADDGPDAAGMLVTAATTDEADAWNVLQAVTQLVERGVIDPWCLRPALHSQRVRRLVEGRAAEGRQWLASVRDTTLMRFDPRVGREASLQEAQFRSWRRQRAVRPPDTLKNLSLRALLDHGAGQGGERRPTLAAAVEDIAQREPRVRTFEFRFDPGFADVAFIVGALEVACRSEPDERSLPDLLAKHGARWPVNLGGLLEAGVVHPNDRTASGRTLLGEMLVQDAHAGHAWLSVRELLRHGADLSLVDIEALGLSHRKLLLEGLLEHLGLSRQEHPLSLKEYLRANPGDSLVMLADIDDIRNALELMWDREAQGKAATACLAAALQRQDEGTAKAVLGLGAHATGKGWASSPLHLARSTAMAQCLLQQGATPAAQDKDGRTALHHAVQRGDVAMATLLCRALGRKAAGALLDVEDGHGERPIHAARTPEMAELLLSHGARPEARDKGGRTALHRAVQDGDVAMTVVLCRALVERAPRTLNRPDKGRLTPLKATLEHVAKEPFDKPQHVDILHILVNAGARPDAEDRRRMAHVPARARMQNPALDALLQKLGIPSPD